MELNENAQIDTGQVRDTRGSGGGLGGLGGIPIPMGGRGGIVGLVVLALMVLGGFVGGNALLGGSEADNAELNQACSTANPDRLERLDCRNALYVNSIQAYWRAALPERMNTPYQPADTVFFSQAVQTGCGSASSGAGPFYCPVDDQVYIDLAFYQELSSRFGASGEFAQPYVLAHEYGHHVQDLVGTEALVRRKMERDPDHANAYSVMLELQADCYAGVWTKHATQTTDAAGVPIFQQVTQQDINQALEAAAAVGDDAITGSSDESNFTHGSSAQRQHWFGQGYQSGDPNACNTFGSALNG
ncbi:MAG: neutral zinc metallopeptidase [Micromonosporaceae bacterium]